MPLPLRGKESYLDSYLLIEVLGIGGQILDFSSLQHTMLGSNCSYCTVALFCKKLIESVRSNSFLDFRAFKEKCSPITSCCDRNNQNIEHRRLGGL